MGNVQFDEEKSINTRARTFSGGQKGSGSPMVSLVMKTGIVKSEFAANLVLLFVAGLAFASAVFLYYQIIMPSKVIPPVFEKNLPPEFKAKFPGLKTI
jgi:hypothetical protein